MTSTLAWLDHSERQRRRMMEVVALFREKGTLDEMGIGSVRDALSEALFPGGSTLHTRGRYLLFVPWLCQLVEEAGVESRRALDLLRRHEIQMIESLVAAGESRGVIGIDARDRVQQTPSMVYWGALGRYGIRRRPGTRTEWARSLGSRRRLKAPVLRTDDGELIDASAGYWHAGLPPRPEDLLERAEMTLSVEEAEYLAERLLHAVPGTYLAHLIGSVAEPASSEFPWEHPAAATATETVGEHLEHARNFSEVMHGAALLYNLVLAELVEDARTAGGEVEANPGGVDEYHELLAEWVELMRQRSAAHRSWDRASFWGTVLAHNPRVPYATRHFVNRWLDLALDRADVVVEDEEARRSVITREIQVKRGLARTRNARALERWTGASGARQLKYRWGQFSRVVFDITDGLRGQGRNRARA